MPTTLFTIGHSTRSLEEFLALLREFSVRVLLDVRAIPRSRTNPQFNVETLPQALAGVGLSYRHLPALGGRRKRSADAGADNALWRNVSFRAYADYAQTESFEKALAELIQAAGKDCCAIMCSEALWWHCHRRIIADYLLARGFRVCHIMGPGKALTAELTPGAQVLAPGRLVYPAAAGQAT